MSDLTPMMRQYFEIKKKNPGAILFFRLGDFYEMFGEDARTASKVLQITLTARGAGENRKNKMEMCGVPYHAASGYILKLIRNGFKVAVCEQMEDPKDAKGIVKRDVVKVITPGTVFEDAALDSGSNNYIVGVYLSKDKAGIACMDATTGEFFGREISVESGFDPVIDAVARMAPAEILLPESYDEDKKTGRAFTDRLRQACSSAYINMYQGWNFDYSAAYEALKGHFGTHNLEPFSIEGKHALISAAGALISYIKETQKAVLVHINKIRLDADANRMQLDAVTLRNLEILTAPAGPALCDILDYTLTAMGGRELKKWLREPLMSPEGINSRLDITSFLIQFPEHRDAMREVLKDIADIERIAGKTGTGAANARDLNALKASAEKIIQLGKIIKKAGSEPLSGLFTIDESALEELAGMIGAAITEEPPVSIKEGGIIRPEYDERLNSLKESASGGREWIAGLQERERKRTGISTLKVGYTSVFGYYIEISRANLKNAPENYIRKQTLVNAERFITPELKEHESAVLGAQEKITALEYEIFCGLRERAAAFIPALQDTAEKTAAVDALISFAVAAEKNNYCRPVIRDDSALVIDEGRHPVIETTAGYNEFIPNNTALDTKDTMIMMITGPNMAGKSTYMRQAALIVIMAQAGSFVPAKAAQIGVVDRVFTRVGASDYLAKGQSTFMVEMIETSNILNNAGKRSLILLDEVGRGTSTFDGVSIAWAVTAYIHDKIGARTMFATHYYELTEMAELFPGIRNFNIQVKEWADKIIFLRKIIEGSTDRSYGIHVGRLAGLPNEVIQGAKVILHDLENANYTKEGKPRIGADKAAQNGGQLDLFMGGAEEFRKALETVDVEGMTPVEALVKLKELKDKYGK
ncbi:MAG TPA: DNA mismatch repair protein MutS [bacterium]|nr:DNA mismatch repair protein MutS [bacterium]